MDPSLVPNVVLNSGHKMPMIGYGTGVVPLPPNHELLTVFIAAIEAGYRHFDTAAYYGSEEALGQAIAQALQQGRIKSRTELFVTTKLWCTSTHPGLVVPALKKSLERLGLEYVDLYLIHFPVRLREGVKGVKYSEGDILPIDMKGVEMNVSWQQENMRKFCKEKGIHVSGWSPLGSKGSMWGSNAVIDNPILKDIAISTGKTVGQVALRWLIGKGVTPIMKSFNNERMKQNLQIFDWELSEVDLERIEEIPQHRAFQGERFITQYGPFKTMEDFWA
ncbi:unnamed protein product [Lupinus luteus]|uniref:NADP-dependent oxidoreductase domain-containing protein n=1 Tax=Lupinus luteus TaxID=3873 RepID=A0AAV1YEX1_LUPLU